MRHLLRPQLMARRIEEIDCHALYAQGIRGMLIDLDNTLTPWCSQLVSLPVADWVKQLKRSGVRPCMVTNAAGARRVRPVALSLEIPWVIRANKPLPGGFRRGMALTDTAPAATAMVGDMMLTDIVGANRLGLFTVLVTPLETREAWLARYVQRPLERILARVVG